MPEEPGHGVPRRRISPATGMWAPSLPDPKRHVTTSDDPPARDRLGLDRHDVRPRPRCPGPQSHLGRLVDCCWVADLLGFPDDNHAPAIVLVGVNRVRLEGHDGIPGGSIEFGALSGAEGYRRVQSYEVDRKDGRPSLHNDRNPSDLHPPEQAEALFGVEDFKSSSIKRHRSRRPRRVSTAPGTFDPNCRPSMRDAAQLQQTQAQDPCTSQMGSASGTLVWLQSRYSGWPLPAARCWAPPICS